MTPINADQPDRGVSMRSDDKPFGPDMIRSVIDKSVALLERRCIRLNGRDPNWRALFDDHLELGRRRVHTRLLSYRP